MVAVGAIPAPDVHETELPMVLDSAHETVWSRWMGVSLAVVAVAFPARSLKETPESLKETFSFSEREPQFGDRRYQTLSHGRSTHLPALRHHESPLRRGETAGARLLPGL